MVIYKRCCYQNPQIFCGDTVEENVHCPRVHATVKSRGALFFVELVGQFIKPQK